MTNRVGPRIWPYAATMSLLALAEVLFASPLLAALGFEFSTLMALSLSLVCGIFSVVWSGFQPARTQSRQTSRDLFVPIFAIATAPLLISFISLIWLPNCSLWDGIIFYIEIAYPSAIFGVAFGVAFARIFRTRRTATIVFILFWIFTLILSLLPGYTNPQLFTYGWQYGFFPGLVWDESLELSNVYLFCRMENVLWAAFLLAFAYEWRPTKPIRARFLRIGVLALAAVITFALHDNLGITVSHQAVLKQLSREAKIEGDCWVHWAPGSMTPEESARLLDDVRWYLHDVRRRFELHDTTELINIYIYPSIESLYEHLGTRSASIAKPWLGEVHISRDNLRSLKHELTHVLLREKGVFPFYASWSTGLTEGAAMSVEPVYDGIYTLDEHAAHLLQLGYATGVKSVMAFTGFAANASAKSYVLAGSFSRFLLSTYGAKPFNKVYASLDFTAAYGKPLDTLESEWKAWLAPLMTPLDAGDSAHFRYYYDRASILFTPCVRRIGKLERKAGTAMSEKHYPEALGLYCQAVEEGGGISPLYGEATALLRERNFAAAVNVLDTTQTATIRKQAAALDNELGDLKWLTGDSISATSHFEDAESVKLSSRTFLDAYTHLVLMRSDIHSIWKQRLEHIYAETTYRASESYAALDTMVARHKHLSGFDTVGWVLSYLRSALMMREGRIREALVYNPYYVSWGNVAPQLSSSDSLTITLITLYYATIGTTPVPKHFTPVRYHRAIEEQATEITAERDFLRQESARRGHGNAP